MKFFLLIASVLLSHFAWASCPDISGTFGGLCDEVNCHGSRVVRYRIKISQNACESVKLFNGEVYKIGVPKDEGNDLNSSKIRTIVTYFDQSLFITEILGSDLSKPAMVSVQSLKKYSINGQKLLDVRYELSGASCGNVIMTCSGLKEVP